MSPPLRLSLVCGLVVGLMLPMQRGRAQGQSRIEQADSDIRFEHIRMADGLSTDVVRTLIQDQQGFLWIGTGNGLNRYDGYTFTHILSGNSVWAVAEDHDGMIWAPSPPGLMRLDPETGTVTPFQLDADDPQIRALYVDKTGILWIGSEDGLAWFEQATGTFTHFRHSPDDATSLSIGEVRAIYEDRRGVLWVGLNHKGGLSRYDPDTDRFITVLADLTVLVLYEDIQGRFWMGTESQGLWLLDRTTGATTVFTTADGLIRNRVSQIVEDAQGYLWLTTPGGLSRFDPEHRRFVTFNEDDGIPVRDGFSSVRMLKSRSGTLFMGGDHGLTEITPDQIIADAHTPQVVVTGLQVFDTLIHEGWILPESIRLVYDQNDLTFNYVGLHYAQPEKNRYAYQLEGYDADWREASAARTARYTSLGPGTYTFHVKASNADGVWNETGASVQVTIMPPWWRTSGAYLLYGLLFIGLVVTADRLQRRRLIARERAKAQTRELEQAKKIEKAHTELQESHQHLKATQAQLIQSEKMASLGQLTAGIAHEIKNPLNFVNNFAEIVGEMVEELGEELETHKQDIPDKVTHNFKEILADLRVNSANIEKHGKRAEGIVHAMMQHASAGSGEREETDVNHLVSEHVDLAYHGKRAQHPEL